MSIRKYLLKKKHYKVYKTFDICLILYNYKNKKTHISFIVNIPHTYLGGKVKKTKAKWVNKEHPAFYPVDFVAKQRNPALQGEALSGGLFSMLFTAPWLLTPF